MDMVSVTHKYVFKAPELEKVSYLEFVFCDCTYTQSFPRLYVESNSAHLLL
jgi:hypothetical protein